MLDKPIDQLDVQDLQSLVDNAVLEFKTIEYKQSLPGNTDSQKKEFLADVSSLANSSGGHLIYGMVQAPDSGKPVSVQGLAVANLDQEILRLEAMIRDGIEPRIASIATKIIPLKDSTNVLVLRIPKSWIAPHRVSYQHHDRFYARSSNGKYPMDVSELRLAFSLSETVAERIRNFRRERTSRILADETPVPIGHGAKIVLHLVPVASFNPGQSHDIARIASQPHKMYPIYCGGMNYRYNYDGFLTYSGQTGGTSQSYTQLFRSGIIEAVECSLLEPHGEEKYIPSIEFERRLIESLGNYVSVLKALGSELPVFVFLNLLEVKGYRMAFREWRLTGSVNTIDRDLLLLPEVLIETYEVNPDAVLRPLFDSIWNACGYAGSPYYDEAGKWVGRQR